MVEIILRMDGIIVGTDIRVREADIIGTSKASIHFFYYFINSLFGSSNLERFEIIIYSS